MNTLHYSTLHPIEILMIGWVVFSILVMLAAGIVFIIQVQSFWKGNDK